MKRILIFVLALAMAISFGIVAASAEEISRTYEASTKEELEMAFGSVADGDTILITADIDLGQTVLTMQAAGKITIDFAGFTITTSGSGTAMLYVTGGCNLILTDSSESKDGGLFAATADGSLSNLIRVATDATMIIKEGSYHQVTSNNGSGMIDSRGDEIVTITGGTFQLDNVGTMQNGSPWILNTSGKNEQNIIVSGGTYNADVYHQHFIFEVESPNDKASRSNGDGTWTIVDAVAYVNEQHYSSRWYTQIRGYETLQEAIDAVKTTGSAIAEEVTLLVNGQTATATKLITINKNGFTANVYPDTGLATRENESSYTVKEANTISVGSKEELDNALLEAEDYDIIVMTGNIAYGNVPLTIVKPVVIDGGSFTLSVSADCAVDIATATGKMVVLKNLTVNALQTGINVNTLGALKLENVDISADVYALRLLEGASACDVKIYGSALKGTIGAWSENSTIAVNGSDLICVNGNGAVIIANDNITFTADEESTLTSDTVALVLGYGDKTCVSGVKAVISGAIEGKIISSASQKGNTVTVDASYAEAVKECGFKAQMSADEQSCSVVEFDLKEFFEYIGYSVREGGTGFAIGFGFDALAYKAYCSRNGEVEFGTHFAVVGMEAIETSLVEYADGSGIFNVVVVDLRAEHASINLEMTLYFVENDVKKYINYQDGVVTYDEVVKTVWNVGTYVTGVIA